MRDFSNLISNHLLEVKPLRRTLHPSFNRHQHQSMWSGVCVWFLLRIPFHCTHSTSQDWFKINPWGLRYILNWVKDRWGNPPIYITENGRADTNGLNDLERIFYLRNYTNEMLKGKTSGLKGDREQERCNHFVRVIQQNMPEAACNSLHISWKRAYSSHILLCLHMINRSMKTTWSVFCFLFIPLLTPNTHFFWTNWPNLKLNTDPLTTQEYVK